MKYFCACGSTCVGRPRVTKFRDAASHPFQTWPGRGETDGVPPPSRGYPFVAPGRRSSRRAPWPASCSGARREPAPRARAAAGQRYRSRSAAGNAPRFDVFDILLFVEARGGGRCEGMGSRQPEGSGEDATSDDARRTGKMASISALSFSRRAIVARGESAGEEAARARTWRRLKRLFRPIILLPGIVAVLNWRFEGRGAGGVSARAREGSSVVNSFYARTAVDRISPRSGS